MYEKACFRYLRNRFAIKACAISDVNQRITRKILVNASQKIEEKRHRRSRG
jgi:hypothetical protein